MIEESDLTAINAPVAEESIGKMNGTYTIDGRKIDEPTQKGIYIRDGRKVVLK